MRQEVYVKFAEAIRAGRADARHAHVQVKFAAAVALVRASRPVTKEAQVSGMPNTTLQEAMRRWFTPANVGGAIAGLGGVYALTRATGIPLSKLVLGGLGAGALYGGYKLFTNPDLRELANIYGRTAMDYLGGKLKSITSQPTLQQPQVSQPQVAAPAQAQGAKA